LKEPWKFPSSVYFAHIVVANDKYGYSSWADKAAADNC